MDLDQPDRAQLVDLARRYPTQALVPAELADQPLAAIVGPLFAISPTLTQVLLLRGSIWLDGKRVLEPNQPAPEGGRLVVHTPPNGEYVSPQVAPEMILYEDATLLVLNKPPG